MLRRGLTVSAILLVFVVCTLPFWARSCGFGVMIREGVKSQLARKRLLCETNYDALLACSRDLLKMVAEGRLKPDLYRAACDRPSPQVSQFPKLILDLAPELVHIDAQGFLTIEMRSHGMDHCGVIAYPEDFKIPYPGFEYGGQGKLIDGLWYYDNEYIYDPAYDKVIDRLIEKGRQVQGEEREK